MIFTETKLKGAFIIEPEKREDERGFFARSYDQKIFSEYGLNPRILQCNMCHNKYKGTIRGMHRQISPYEEAKYIRCTKGSIFDVIIDLRPKSETYKQWIGVELNDKNYKMIYIPEGFAAGMQTLEDNTELFYQVSQVYMPEYESGIRWNDPAFQIKWPLKPTVISHKDASYEFFKE